MINICMLCFVLINSVLVSAFVVVVVLTRNDSEALITLDGEIATGRVELGIIDKHVHSVSSFVFARRLSEG